MDKIVFDNESLDFVADWLTKNKIVIQRVPQILPHYLIDYSAELDGKIGKSFIECKWLDENTVWHKANLTRVDGSTDKFEWVATFSYNDKTEALVRMFSDVLGKPESEVERQIGLDRKSTNCNFEVGVTRTINGVETEVNYTEVELHFCATMTYMNIYVSYFIMNYEQEVIEYVGTERETVKAKKKSNGKKKSGGAKSITTTVIRVSRYVKDVQSGKKSLPRRKNNKCQYSFSVRRHIRHYKNGKTVEIKSYVKNKLADRLKREREIRLDLKRRDKEDGKNKSDTGKSNDSVSETQTRT